MILAFAWPIFWVRFDALQRWPWALLAVVALLLLAFRSRGKSSPPTSVFRVLIIVCISLALLEPVISRPRQLSESGPIVLLLDVSRSMAAHDLLRPPGRKVALARALGRLPADAIDPAVNRLRERVDRLSQRVAVVVAARGELDYARMVGRHVPSARVNLDRAIADLHNEAIITGDVPMLTARMKSDFDTMADPALGPTREPWLNKLPDALKRLQDDVEKNADEADAQSYRTRSDVRAVCDDVAAMSRADLEWLAALRCEKWIHETLGAGTRVEAIAFGNGTQQVDLHTADFPSLTRSSLGDATQLTTVARGVATNPAEPPLATLLFSDGRPADDGAVTLPNTNGSDGPASPVFTVRTAPNGMLRDVSLSNLSADSWAYRGQTVYARAQVQASGLGAPSVRLSIRLGQTSNEQVLPVPDNFAVVVRPSVPAEGVGVESLSLSASPVDSGTTESTGIVSQSLRIVDAKPQVLWASDAELPALPFVQFTEVGTGGDLAPSAVEKADVVVLDDVAVDRFTKAGWATLLRSVRERGLGVIFIGRSVERMQSLFQDPSAAALVPARADTQWTARTGDEELVTLQPVGTEVGPLFGLTRMASTLQFQQSPPNTFPILIDHATKVPVLLAKNAGAGRSLLLLAVPDDPEFTEQQAVVDRLWTTMIRNACKSPFAISLHGSQLDIDPPAGDSETRFHVRYECPTATRSRTLELRRDGQRIKTLTLSPSYTSSETTGLSTTLPRLPVGGYSINLQDDPSLAVHFNVVRPATTETENLTGRSDLLRRISRASGGIYVELDELDRLFPRLKSAAYAPRPPIDWKLCNGPVLLAFIVGCLTIDWSLRKHAGLA